MAKIFYIVNSCSVYFEKLFQYSTSISLQFNNFIENFHEYNFDFLKKS